MANNELVIIQKIEKYIEYMLIILLKLPRTEKFSIGIEVKTSVYNMLKNVLLASKVERNEYTILVPYNEYGKFLIRNNYEIRRSIYLRLKELYEVELTSFKFTDLKLDENNYVVIMPLINMETLARLYCYFDANEDYKNIYIFGLEEYKEVIKTFLPKCEYKSLSREKVNELIEKYQIIEK